MPKEIGSVEEALRVLSDESWVDDLRADLEAMTRAEREREIADAYQAGFMDGRQTLQDRAGGTEDWASVADTSDVLASRTKPRKNAHKKR